MAITMPKMKDVELQCIINVTIVRFRTFCPKKALSYITYVITDCLQKVIPWPFISLQIKKLFVTLRKISTFKK